MQSQTENLPANREPSYRYPRDNDESRAAVNTARTVLPVLLAEAGPIRSAVDIGCGYGEWLYVCKEQGLTDIIGADGAWVDRSKILISESEFTSVDCSQPFDLQRTFDLALCTELAEHVPDGSADSLVASLTRLAPLIVWSAAIPYQGGKDHINEQWPEYWAGKFARHGFVPLEEIRQLIWDRADLIWWYKQNLMLYVHADKLDGLERLKAACARHSPIPSRVVHPDLFLKKMTRQIHVRDAISEVGRALGRAWRSRFSGRSKAGKP